MDHFYEQAVVKHHRTADEVLFYLSLAMMIVFALYALILLSAIMYQFDLITLVKLLAAGGIAAALWFYRPLLRTEYEYTFTNGEMDFAKIFNNAKRKTLGSLKVRNIDAFGKVNSDSFRRYLSMPGIIQMRWFLNREAELYYFYFQKNGVKKLMIIEPDDEMLSCIRHYVPNQALQDG